MIRIYYDPTTGMIKKTVTLKYAPPMSDLPYIDVESPVNSQKYKINLENKSIIPNPDYQPPQPFSR